MQTNYDPRISKRKLTSFWALALYLISTVTYSFLMYKVITTNLRYKQSPTNAVDALFEKKTGINWRSSLHKFHKIDLQNITIKERETIIFYHLLHQAFYCTYSFLFLVLFYLIFKNKFLQHLQTIFYFYLVFYIFTENDFPGSFETLVVVCVCIYTMIVESQQDNIKKMVILFNSFIELLCKSALIIGINIVITASFIIFQIYMIANIHFYIPDVNILIYILLILYFLFSTFTSFFFLCSFITSLAFYSMLHNGNLLLVLIHSYQNVFYLSGEICNYGLNYYKNMIVNEFSFLVSIYVNPIFSKPLKIFSTFMFLTTWFVAPFYKLISTNGYHVISFLTLSGQSCNNSCRKVDQMVNDINLMPYFGSKTEYSYYLKGFMAILLMRGYVTDSLLILITECRLSDKLMLFASGFVIVHFSVFIFKVMYSTVLFLFFICGDLMKERNQKLYKFFDKKRDEFLQGVFL
ncbi:hypothetical protein NBO_483g0001 [Nosema bombycis CQ1]|uniref:Uncharacterized protein n=1 Tax=Nosema bombycis (strain CQ1 / CVCC 102059) TaxID=578461 RepID=R0MDV0_NOSB1|nr:hypothetical protein NBO_483g0001 [Nosema bombycis CQ1]|eukprot:EOB12260.1 hypothetical protein NBO_483g0001 [Nosema bombycis CQ1]